METQGLLSGVPRETSWSGSKLIRWVIWTLTLSLLVYVTLDALANNQPVKRSSLSVEKKALISNYNYYVVALLKNNEKIMGNWNSELLQVVEAFKPGSVYVSILENGDSEDRTAELLHDLGRQLDDRHVSHSIITDNRIKRGGKNRIEFLAELRNLAMQPLYGLKEWDPKMTRIVFLNDVWFRASDIFELIATNRGEYDIACALDFYFTFYDTWVSRDIKGKGLWPAYPYFHDSSAREQQRVGQAVRMFSCWNGAAVLQAEPFLKKSVRFRHSTALEPYHSECFWISHDFWRSGFTRVLLNPNVIVAYTKWHFYLQKYIYPIFVNPITSLLFWLSSADRANIDSLPSTARNVPASAAHWHSYL